MKKLLLCAAVLIAVIGCNQAPNQVTVYEDAVDIIEYEYDRLGTDLFFPAGVYCAANLIMCDTSGCVQVSSVINLEDGVIRPHMYRDGSTFRLMLWKCED